MNKTIKLIFIGIFFLMIVLLYVNRTWGQCCGDDSFSTTGKHKLVGKISKDFTLKDIDGKKITLSEFKEKIIVLNFFGTWCEHSQMNIRFIDNSKQL